MVLKCLAPIGEGYKTIIGGADPLFLWLGGPVQWVLQLTPQPHLYYFLRYSAGTCFAMMNRVAWEAVSEGGVKKIHFLWL
jgi:hypothetical protein